MLMLPKIKGSAAFLLPGFSRGCGASLRLKLLLDIRKLEIFFRDLAFGLAKDIRQRTAIDMINARLFQDLGINVEKDR